VGSPLDIDAVTERLLREYGDDFNNGGDFNFWLFSIDRDRLEAASSPLLTTSRPVSVSLFEPAVDVVESRNVGWSLGELRAGRASYCLLQPDANGHVGLWLMDVQGSNPPLVDAEVYIIPALSVRDLTQFDEFRGVVAYVAGLTTLLQPKGVGFVGGATWKDEFRVPGAPDWPEVFWRAPR
jgi:hypothetical protein